MFYFVDLNKDLNLNYIKKIHFLYFNMSNNYRCIFNIIYLHLEMCHQDSYLYIHFNTNIDLFSILYSLQENYYNSYNQNHIIYKYFKLKLNNIHLHKYFYIYLIMLIVYLLHMKCIYLFIHCIHNIRYHISNLKNELLFLSFVFFTQHSLLESTGQKDFGQVSTHILFMVSKNVYSSQLSQFYAFPLHSLHQTLHSSH